MFKKLFRFIMDDADAAKAKQRPVKLQPRKGGPTAKDGSGMPPETDAVSDVEDQETIQQAIAEASRLVELERAASGSTPDRQELIHAAMNIYRAKQASLDDLDPEERARLRLLSEVMASAKAPKTH